MVAAVNPCGFVMLPAYLTIYLRDESDVDEDSSLAGVAKRGTKAIYVSLAMGFGFVALFGSAGLLVYASQELVKETLPWIGFILGILMAFLGAYMLIGGKIYTGIAQRMADRVGDPRVSSLGGYFLFGISYALRVVELHATDLPERGDKLISPRRSLIRPDPIHRLRWRNGIPDHDRDDRDSLVQERGLGATATIDAVR